MTSVPLISVSTCVMPHEVGNKCVQAVEKIFPDFHFPNPPDEEMFPINRNPIEMVCEGVSPDRFLELLGEQRIMDTALDAMSLNLGRTGGNQKFNFATKFLISRQAAIRGKIAFVLENERTVGGVIEVFMESDDLVDWIEEATWHPGRTDVPRTVGDELSMRLDGAVTEWFDKKGRATIQTDE